MERDTLFADVRDLLDTHHPEGITALAERVDPSAWADIIPAFGPNEIATLIRWMPEDVLPDVLADLAPIEAATILRTLSRHEAADVLEAMAPDDAADVVDELPEVDAEHILVAMAPGEAAEIRDLLVYPPESAGGVMTPAFVGISPDLRADQAIAALRRVAAEAETIYYVYVIDAEDHLLGVLSLRNLVLASPHAPVSALMVRDVAKVYADEPGIDAARLLRDRNLLAVPVVDRENRLLGIITADDAIDVFEGEFTEDYLRLAGTDAEEMDRRTPAQIARLRLPWLLGTMGIELGAGLVIARFDHVLTEVILLASFMPIISAVSGNVGLQAAAIVVRGLDTGHVSLQRWGQQVSKELQTALLMALTCGLVLGTIGAIWSQHLPFGIVIGVALTASMLTAGFMGTVIPMLSKRLGFDPATTAGPFETAFQDVVGFAVFLWLASLLLQWLR
ncbi:MAG: magnesium transporter [Thermomicrobiales bacterium]|nr:magnesium transporter [Thermomicrobiales bacterium]